MPFTPYHFGPGLLFKSLAPARFSLIAFVGTQVAIDLESLYHLLQRNWPVHRFFHSLPGALLAGLAVAGLLRAASPFASRALAGHRWLRAELAPRAILAGAIAGGLSHSLLDNVMHRDVQLLYPLRAGGEGLHGLVTLPTLHQSCLLAGVAGIGVLAVRGFLARPT